MQIEIVPVTLSTLALVDQFDKSFYAHSRLILNTRDNQLTCTIEPLPQPFTKTYPDFEIDLNSYIDSADKIIYLAFVDQQPAGQIFVRTHWNHYGYIESFVVNAAYRQHGIGRALMNQAIAWAKEHNLRGLTLETQDINATACQFYARFGFQLCGYDTHLYQAFNFNPPEIALYWYLTF